MIDMDFIKAFGSGVKETEHHITTENKGDLISREALKKAIDKLFESGGYDSGLVMDMIDNAPTVSVDCKHCDGYEAGYTAGIHDAIRPQGEWLDIYESHIAHQCSNCKRQMPVPSYFKFCPNCGAYMQKGVKE